MDLSQHIYDLMSRTIQCFVSHGWVQEDIGYVRAPEDLHVDFKGVMMKPRILYYYETRNQNPVAKIWIQCSVFLPRDVDVNLNIKKLKQYLSKFDLKPFRDEDAYYGMFVRSTDKTGTELMFYLNPDYPNGYWENHTL